MTTYKEVINGAIADFKEKLDYYNPQELINFIEKAEPHDFIFETADDNVPIYTADLMEVGADNTDMVTKEPELGPAYDGSPTPINIIAANIFEAIEEKLWEWWNENKDDLLAEAEVKLPEED